MRRFISLIGCLLATLVFVAGPAAAAGGGYNNLVQVDNSDSTHPAVRTASMVSHDTGTADVTNTNLAYSHSFNCTGCRTVTAAVQAVLVEGNPTTIAPQNGAVAFNENCHLCQTFAYAHQYVFVTHYPVAIDARTSRRLQAIQNEISQVANSGKDFPTINGQLDQLSSAFCYTVEQAVHEQQAGENPAPIANVCGSAPYDHRKVQQHQ